MPSKFPDLIHAAKMEADRGYPQAATAHDTLWDFISLMPESTHMAMWIMSGPDAAQELRDQGRLWPFTPFASSTRTASRTFVKFHWKPKAGLASSIWDETVKTAGADPDYQRRDLFDRIGRGEFPSGRWACNSSTRNSPPVNPMTSSTRPRSFPKRCCRFRVVGRLVLDRYPDNFFA